MSRTADMLDEGAAFPHGTVEGYRRGCRTNHCPAGARGYTCSAFRMRYISDWGFARRVDEGWSLEQLAAKDRDEAAAERAAEKAAAKAERDRAAGRSPLATPGRAKAAPPKPAADAQKVKARRERAERAEAARRAREERKVSAAARRAAVELAAASVAAQRAAAETRRLQRLAALHADGADDYQIGEALELSSSRAAQLRRALGLAANRRRPSSKPIEHGTRRGYERGCREPEKCPAPAGVSCTRAAADARREASRRAGTSEQRRAQHGTRGGYRYLMCRDPEQCPSAIAGGPSCRAAAVSVSQASLARRRENSGWARRGRPPIEQHQIDAIARLNGQGMNDYRISEELGISQSTVARYRRGLELPPRGRFETQKGTTDE